METAVLYCSARRTAYCQELLTANGLIPKWVRAANPAVPTAALGMLLQKSRLVLVIGPQRGGVPQFGDPFFQVLHVPVREGKPQGVLMLHGSGCAGWLLESRQQAVALLPDRPAFLRELLPQLLARLQEKFSLPEKELPPAQAVASKEGLV